MSDADLLLDEIIATIRGDDVPDVPREILAGRLQVILAQRNAEHRPQWRIRYSKYWQAVAAVALILAGVIAAILMSLGERALAVADVAKAVGATQSMKCRILHFSNDPNYLRQYDIKLGEPSITQLYRSGNRLRIEGPLDMVSIIDPERGLMMSIWHKNRRAVLQSAPREELLRQATVFYAMLRDVPAASAKKLPDETMNGRPVSEFQVQKNDLEYQITVDPTTSLPIRIEVVNHQNPSKGQLDMREIYTDFVFDVPLDDSLFRIEAPAGYSVEREILPKRLTNPLETNELVVSSDGIGPVKFGMKVDDILRLLGEPDSRKDFSGVAPAPIATRDPAPKKYAGTILTYQRQRLELQTLDPTGLVRIECHLDREGDPSHAGFRGRTKEGIALGASMDNVRKTYGEPDAKTASGPHWYYSDRGYRFDFDEKKLVSLVVTRPYPNSKRESGGKPGFERAKP